MKETLISTHKYLLGYECEFFNEEFDLEKVEMFLNSITSSTLIEYAGETFLRTISPSSARIKIIEAYKHGQGWFVIFEMKRFMCKRYKGIINNTFVYIKGKTAIYSIAEKDQGGDIKALSADELIYSSKAQ